MSDEDEPGHHPGGPPVDGKLDKYPFLAHYEKGYTEVADLEVEYQGFLHVRCPWTSHNCPKCNINYCHTDSLIVAVDGACRFNSTLAAQGSACGVYLSPTDETLNTSWSISEPNGTPHTSQRAELVAAAQGIKTGMEYVRNGGQVSCKCPDCRVKHLVIKSDSAYVVNGITEYVKKWKVNGWRNAKGDTVANLNPWKSLVECVDQVTELGAIVSFWHVKRHDNEQADRLANRGLDN